MQEEVVKNIEIIIKKREENYKENIERIIQIMIKNGKRIIKKKEIECGGRGQED